MAEETPDKPKRAPRTPKNSVSPVETSVTAAADPTEAAAVVVESPGNPHGTGPVEVEATPAPAIAAPDQATAVVGDGDTDPVSLRNIVYKNIKQRKSLSVHHLQRRLNELGYAEAYADRDGFYGDLTRDAVARYQKDHNFVETGIVDQGTLASVFDGDPNVTIVP